MKPKKRGYNRMQIDEKWPYLVRKDEKVWILYTYAEKEGEIVAFTMGKSSAATFKNLWVKLKRLDTELFLTDD